MNRWKRLVSVSVVVCLLSSFTVQAEVLIPPIPVTNATEGTTENIETGVGQEPTTESPQNQSQQNQSPQNQSEPANQSGPGVGGSATTKDIAKPEIQAEGAVLMDAATGKLLFEKNPDVRYYPASITKLMTALLVLEHSNLDDTVTFSATATTNLESGAVSLNITEGDKLTVRQSLYALLLKSANEVANGLAEHISGSVENFAKQMNEKAKALGCTNTNFVNPHGLNNSNHYTTPRDMALIARAAFQNEALCKIDTTLTYQMPATKKEAAKTITMGHKMMHASDSRYYAGVIGGKTGYTSLAGNTLVTGVERDGVRLIAVIMKSKSTQYTDTKALFDYGFEVMKAGGSSEVSSPSAEVSTGWVEDSTGWYYLKSDSNRASEEWQTINQEEYWFDSNAYMATGWRQFSNGAWYYFKPSGAMARNYWVENNGKWFYMGADGAMLKNTTTPDNHQLDESGVLIQ